MPRPDATLSPTEFASLRRVSNGLVNTVSSEHKDVLLAMGLVFEGLDGLEVTAVGRRRLERSPRPWRGVAKSNLLDVPPGK